jgi:hypothetical protein
LDGVLIISHISGYTPFRADPAENTLRTLRSDMMRAAASGGTYSFLLLLLPYPN